MQSGAGGRKSGESSSGGAGTTDRFAELKDLINADVRSEVSQLEAQSLELTRTVEVLETRLRRIRAELVRDMAKSLPLATKKVSESSKYHAAMLPVTKENIRLFAKDDPTTFGDVLFPVMGPAIRKSIRENINAMMQRLNEVLDHSVSLRGMQWRVEAMRTGRPFSEVVFLHTTVYRVEQVFLIHRETGLLLQYAAMDGSPLPVKDPDVVSGMLSAIQDFVRDSFSTRDEDALDTLKMGEFTVWVEQGPTACVAAVVRGFAPEKELRGTFQVALTEIHREQQEELRRFAGDTGPFAVARPHLEGCLQFELSRQEREKAEAKQKALATMPRWWPKSGAHWVVLGVLVLLLATAAMFVWNQSAWRGYLAQLRQEPGVAVTRAAYWWPFAPKIEGLRDPFARDPQLLLAGHGFDTPDVDSHWTPYLAMEPQFILARARTALVPPKGVTLTVDPQGVLEASGEAPHDWILNARRIAGVLPGVTRFKDGRLADADWQQVQRLREEVQEYNILFAEGIPSPMASQRESLSALATRLASLVALAGRLGQSVAVEVLGHTDSSGGELLNQSLSQGRAETVLATLRRALPAGVRLTPKGVANGDPARKEVSGEDRAWNRRVTVKVTVRAAESRTP